MKALHIDNLGKTNLIFTSVAIAGYITIYFGFIPHMALGLFQVILCIFLIAKRKEILKPLKELITIYGVLVITDLAFFYVLDSQYAIWAWAASFAIAFFFTYIMYQLQKLQNENN